MVNICFRTFKESLPEVGRKVIVWGDRHDSFGSSYIGKMEGTVSVEEFDDGEGGWYDALCVGEYEIGEWNTFAGPGIGTSDSWAYSDDIFPVLYDNYFYEDWKWYAKKGYAKFKVKEVSEIIIDKYKRKNRFIDYVFEMNGKRWLMSFNRKYLYKVEEI